MDFYDFGIQEWLMGFAILAGLLTFFWRQKWSIWRLLFFSVFWLYLLLLVKSTLFPIPINGERWTPAGMQPWQYTLQQVNLIPFKYLMEPNMASINHLFGEILNNILLSLPFGFGIRFFSQLKRHQFIGLALLAGFSIETAQLTLSLLFDRYHTIDITDVILNGLGVLVGYTLFNLFAWLHQQGLGAYIDEVVQRSRLGSE